jgi:hypothetical protein
MRICDVHAHGMLPGIEQGRAWHRDPAAQDPIDAVRAAASSSHCGSADPSAVLVLPRSSQLSPPAWQPGPGPPQPAVLARSPRCGAQPERAGRRPWGLADLPKPGHQARQMLHSLILPGPQDVMASGYPSAWHRQRSVSWASHRQAGRNTAVGNRANTAGVPPNRPHLRLPGRHSEPDSDMTARWQPDADQPGLRAW